MTLVQKLASTIRKKCADFYEVGSRKIASTPGSRLCINLRDFQGVNILLQLLVHCSTLTHQSFLSGGHLNIQLYHFKNRKLQSIQYILFFSASISYCARHQQYRTSEKYCSKTELNHMNIKTSSYSSISQRFIHLSLADNIRR